MPTNNNGKITHWNTCMSMGNMGCRNTYSSYVQIENNVFSIDQHNASLQQII